MAWSRCFISLILILISFTTFAQPPPNCNYVAFPTFCMPFNTTHCTTSTTNTAIPIDICWTDLTQWKGMFTPMSTTMSCSGDSVVANVWWDSQDCDGSSDFSLPVSSSDFKCDSVNPCTYFIQEKYTIPSGTSCVDELIPSNIIPDEFVFVTGYCITNSFGGSQYSLIQTPCDTYGVSTYYQYSGPDCNDVYRIDYQESYPYGVCEDDVDETTFVLDVGCFLNDAQIPSISSTAKPTPAPIEPTAVPTNPTRKPIAPTSKSTETPAAATTVSEDDDIVLSVNITNIDYDISSAVINQAALSIEVYLSSLSVAIDYTLNTVDGIIMIQFYGTSSELTHVDKEEVVALIRKNLNDSFGEEESSSNTNNNAATNSRSLEQTTFVIMIFLVIFTLVAFIYGKKIKRNDYFQVGSLFSASLQILDCISDILFAVNITDHPQYSVGSTLFTLFLLSIVFILLPIFTSVFQLKTIIYKHWKQNDQMRAWLRDHIYYLFMLSLICGSSFAAIKMCSSNAFDLKFLSIPLSKTDKSHFQYKRVYSVVLLENIPQLIIALCFAIITSGADSQNNDIVYISMTFSALSIIMMVVSSLATKKLIETQDHSVLVLHVTGPMFMENTKKCQNRTNGIRDHLSILLGVDHALIEIPKPQYIHRGLRLEILLLMSHSTIIELQIEKKIYDKNTKLAIEDFITACWKLAQKPKVDIVKFEQNQSKEQRRTMDMTSTTKTKTNAGEPVPVSTELTETKKDDKDDHPDSNEEGDNKRGKAVTAHEFID